MRIEQLRFKNLNSLVGEWHIDFTHPSYVSEGIFAITGSTGAGKSTILDAICLALFGRTPRLSAITASTNEIMSRHTGECSAEVTFSCAQGRFRCHWHQHRAKKNPNGALQQPAHEISDVVTEKLLTNKKSEVPGEIEKYTGMDFDRFTRSVLLAQGGFSVFLQAGPDERAPLLEQITGTEIYTRISQRVHEQKKMHETLLKQDEDALAEMHFLSPEKENETRELLEKARIGERSIGSGVKSSREALVWLNTIAGIDNEQKKLVEQYHNHEKERPAFISQQYRYTQSLKALEFEAEYILLCNLRGEEVKRKEQILEYENAVNVLDTASKEADKNLTNVNTQLLVVKTALEKLAPVFQQTRVLDTKKNQKAEQLKKMRLEFADEEKKYRELLGKQEKYEREKREQITALEHCRAMLIKHQSDAALVEEMTGISEQCRVFCVTSSRMERKTEEQSQLQKRIKEYSTIIEREKETLTRLQNSFHTTLKEQKKNQSAQSLLLGDRTFDDVQSEERLFFIEKEHLAKILEIFFAKESLAKELKENFIQQEECQKKYDASEKALIYAHERRDSAVREQDLLESKLLLERRIASYEEARSSLKIGETCPLCGSIEHPFVTQGMQPTITPTEVLLNESKKALQALQNSVLECSNAVTNWKNELGWILLRQKEYTEKLTKLCKELTQLHHSKSVISTVEQATQLLEKVTKDHATAAHRVQRITQLFHDVECLNKTLEEKQKKVTEQREILLAAENQEKTWNAELDQVEKIIHEQTEELRLAKADFDTLFAPYGLLGLAPYTVEKINDIRDSLTDRLVKWRGLAAKEGVLEKKLGELEVNIKHDTGRITGMKDALEQSNDKITVEHKEYELLESERGKIFGDAVVESEEKKLDDKITIRQAEQKVAENKLFEVNNELVQLKKNLTAEQELLQKCSHLLLSKELLFTKDSNSAGFHDEKVFVAALLAKEERELLEQLVTKFQEETTKITSLQSDALRRLNDERNKMLTTAPKEELEKEVTELNQQIAQLQRDIGAFERDLKNNDQLRELEGERQKNRMLRKAEVARWTMLHSLIGSSDGKKYRNFVQGLTFEVMVAHANVQLQKMTDRYTLARSRIEPLELNVIDHYQAGDERSSRNLSGGESFIVSLALALGLAGMALGKIQVDSLFLDEGFGMLDEEALETALETLAGLQRQGKLIGVISHVAAVKERIRLQIEVRPGVGGNSVLDGAGCSYIEG